MHRQTYDKVSSSSSLFYIALSLTLFFFVACYIEIDADECSNVKDESYTNSQWCNLPDLLLEEIFSYLEIRER